MVIQKSKETRRPVILEPVVSPHLSASERHALRWRCADRGIAALTLAVEGYDNVRRLEGDRREAGKLRSLRDHSAFLTLVGKKNSDTHKLVRIQTPINSSVGAIGQGIRARGPETIRDRALCV
jgi:hypothetical protein